MKTYKSIIELTKEQRADSLREATAHTGNAKITVTKILAAMIDSGDCPARGVRDAAMEITGKDIRENFQSVYELLAVFQAVMTNKIGITEEQFDTIESSKLALLSPFLSKDELKPFLSQAVELAIKGGTAKEIRDLKPKGDPKEPKAVKAIREKLEAEVEKTAAAEKRVADAEERLKTVESRYTVGCVFAVTDIEAGTAILRSPQLRDRLKTDMLTAMNNGDEETLVFMHDTLSKAYFNASRILGVDPHDALHELAAASANPAKNAAAVTTLEVSATEVAAEPSKVA